MESYNPFGDFISIEIKTQEEIMSFKTTLETIFSNPTTMAIIGGGTSTAVITYILNKMKSPIIAV